MKVSIKVKPNSKENKVEKISEGRFLVKVKAPAKENRANKEAIEALSEYFNVARADVSIKAGLKTKHKIAQIR